MKTSHTGILIVTLLSAGAIGAGLAQTTAPHPVVTRDQYQRWQTELSNWGRWGKDDELGTLNLITTAKRKQAAALVKDGISVSLSSNANTEREIDNPCPWNG
jgi:hypothetical protein